MLFVVLPTVGARAVEPISGYQTSGSGLVFSAFPTLPAFTIVEAPAEGTVALTSANLAAGGHSHRGPDGRLDPFSKQGRT